MVTLQHIVKTLVDPDGYSNTYEHVYEKVVTQDVLCLFDEHAAEQEPDWTGGKSGNLDDFEFTVADVEPANLSVETKALADALAVVSKAENALATKIFDELVRTGGWQRYFDWSVQHEAAKEAAKEAKRAKRRRTDVI